MKSKDTEMVSDEAVRRETGRVCTNVCLASVKKKVLHAALDAAWKNVASRTMRDVM